MRTVGKAHFAGTGGTATATAFTCVQAWEDRGPLNAGDTVLSSEARGVFCAMLLSATFAHWLDHDPRTAPARQPAAVRNRGRQLARPGMTVTPRQLENVKSYNYPQRHETILQIKGEIDPDIVLIGDSITHHWGGPPGRDNLRAGERVLKAELGDYRTLNLGFGHDRVQNTIWRLQNGEIDGLTPDWVVINIGTNNLTDGNTADEIMAGIRKICEEVTARAPRTRIVLMAVFPRERNPQHPRRKVVADLSDLIAAYATEQKFIAVDLGPKFLTESGELPKELMPDALHLSEAGYTIWAKALKEVFAAHR